MIGCLRTLVRKQPIIALYFKSECELKFNNHEAWLLYVNCVVGFCIVFLNLMVLFVGLQYLVGASLGHTNIAIGRHEK